MVAGNSDNFLAYCLAVWAIAKAMARPCTVNPNGWHRKGPICALVPAGENDEK